MVPMADVGPLLHLHGVCKSFGGIQAVHTISFDVAPGESVGLVGPNGAGKTTLFNCVCGQLRPDTGDIVFEGQSMSGLPTYRRARAWASGAPIKGLRSSPICRCVTT